MMGAFSMGLPMIYVPAGADAARQLARPDARQRHRRLEVLGRAARRQDHARRTGPASRAASRARQGTCMTMGTASTMMSAVEALGFTLPGASSIPAPDSRHAAMATLTGRRIVEMVWEDLTPSQIVLGRRRRQRHHDGARARRLDQRRHPPASRWRAARASRSRSIASTSSRASVPVLANMRPAGQVPHGGLLLRGRPAGAARGARRSARHERAHRERRDAGRGHRRREDLQRRRHSHARQPARDVGRARRAARQPRARRRRDQAARRRAAPAQAQGPGRRLRQLRRDDEAHRRSGPRRRRELGVRAAQRRAQGRPGHARVGPAPRCRRSSCKRACATCCASPTRA